MIRLLSVTKLLKFCFVGGIGALITWGLTWLLTEWVGWWYMGSLVFATFIAMVNNYVLNSIWTFNDTKSKDIVAHQADYDWNSYYHGNPIQKYWKHKIAEYTLGMVENNPILDVGCGASPLLSMIKAKQKTGIDINADKIAFISKKDKTSRYIVSDGSIPIKDTKFCTVICNEVIEHHPRPATLIQELSEVVKDDGVLIISTPDYASIRWNIIEIFYGLLMHSGYELEHGSKFTLTGLTAICNAYGLELEEVKRVFNCDMVCKFRKIYHEN